jgi:hypothetical protein
MTTKNISKYDNNPCFTLRGGQEATTRHHAFTHNANTTTMHTQTHLVVMYKISDAVAVVTDGPEVKHFIPYCGGVALETLKWRR